MITIPRAMPGRLPIVLVVDPVSDSRFAVWRLLHRGFGVLEATSERAAWDWLTSRPHIDAVVVQEKLPDADGHAFVDRLARTGHPLAGRAVVVGRPVDARRVVTALATWCFAPDKVKLSTLLRGADQLVS